MNHRLQITVAGVVQGVGFRPFVFGLASRLGLAGFVTNRAGDVVIEVEGTRAAVERMLDLLRAERPSAARIDRLDARVIAATGESTFEIAASDTSSTAAAAIAPDVATCDACLAEIADPRERRFGYPFASCAACGPRLTIVMAAPYDRARTTMAPFALCDACRAEYEDVADRRFHAQPIACATCGPRLDMSIGALADAILGGEIVALKGLGGYHLVCDATREDVVARLRERKQRDAKPFAIMVRDLDEARRIAELDPVACALLVSPARPIVLAPRLSAIAGVAPNVGDVGVMLPYTPLHALLLAAVDRPLVMTSGNTTDEPIAFVDDDARARLAGIADRVVAHDRAIHMRCEDSVARVADGAPMILRRARGYAPAPVALPVPLDRPTLALGGHFKSAFALGDGDVAFVSPHFGDLDHLSAYEAFERALEHFQRLHRVLPERVVHDLHPDYATTRLAERLGVPCSGIQHHHAHFASAHADALLDGPAIGVIFDGHGYSSDGTIWGGELLVGDCASTRRAAHLRCVPQPGGDRAAREPWRMAIAYLREAGESIDEIVDRRGPIANRVAALCAGAPLTSSTGRLFDAVAAILGICDVSSYEGEAAMRLEALARDAQTAVAYPIHIVPAAQDTGSLFARGSRQRVDAEPIARGSLQNIPIARDSHDIHDAHDLHWLADVAGGARELELDTPVEGLRLEVDPPTRVSRQFEVDVPVDTPPYGSRIDVTASRRSPADAETTVTEALDLGNDDARGLDAPDDPPTDVSRPLDVDLPTDVSQPLDLASARTRELDTPPHGSRRLDDTLVARDFFTPSHGSRSVARASNVAPSRRETSATRGSYLPETAGSRRLVGDLSATRDSRVADATGNDVRFGSRLEDARDDDDDAPTGVSRLLDADTPRRLERGGVESSRRRSDVDTAAPRAARRSDVDLLVTPARGSLRPDDDATATSASRLDSPARGSRPEDDVTATSSSRLDSPVRGSRRPEENVTVTSASRVGSPARGSRRPDDATATGASRVDAIASAAAGDRADILDTLPIIRAVVRDRARGVSPATIARRFHNTLVELAARACVELARREGVRDVVLSGGVFANSILANELPARLRAFGLVPHLQRRVPPNDGGLSFGQLAAIAAADRGAS